MFDVVDLDTRAVGFGGVHRYVSALEQVLGVVGIGRPQGDADASGDSKGDVVDHKRNEQSIADATRSLNCCVLAGAWEQDSELVAAKSGKHVPLT